MSQPTDFYLCTRSDRGCNQFCFDTKAELIDWARRIRKHPTLTVRIIRNSREVAIGYCDKTCVDELLCDVDDNSDTVDWDHNEAWSLVPGSDREIGTPSRSPNVV